MHVNKINYYYVFAFVCVCSAEDTDRMLSNLDNELRVHNGPDDDSNLSRSISTISINTTDTNSTRLFRSVTHHRYQLHQAIQVSHSPPIPTPPGYSVHLIML